MKPTLRRGRAGTVFFPGLPLPLQVNCWLKNDYAFHLSGIKIFLSRNEDSRAQELLLPHLERSLLKVNMQKSWPLWCQRPEILLNQNHELSPSQHTCPPQTRLMFPHLPSASHMAPLPGTLVSLFSIRELLFTLQDIVHMAFPQDKYISGVSSSSSGWGSTLMTLLILITSLNFLLLVSQSFPTLCNPMVCSPPGSSGYGISRERHWSGLTFLPPGDVLDPGQGLCLLPWQADSLTLSHQVSKYSHIGI